MNEYDLQYHMVNLSQLDPDQLVSDLGLTTEQILSAFHKEAEDFIEREFG